MNREQFTNWLILEGWECNCHMSRRRNPYPLLWQQASGDGVYGFSQGKTKRTLSKGGIAEWDYETYPPFPFKKIPARHLAAMRKCLREEGLL